MAYTQEAFGIGLGLGNGVNGKVSFKKVATHSSFNYSKLNIDVVCRAISSYHLPMKLTI